jgi:Protein of unknown function (DUF1761)
VQFGPVNWLAVAAAIVANFLIGGLWYSPLLFVHPWLRMSGVEKRVFDRGLPKALVGDLFASAATVLVLNQVLRWSQANSIGAGLLVALVVWVGFVASTLVAQVTYEQRPFAFFLISSGYRLVTLGVMGAILSIWR